MRAIILAYADPTKNLNYRNVFVVHHVSKPKITFYIFTGSTRKEPPKPRSMTVEEIECDQDPNEYDEDYENK